jgi:hypothetical protein
MLEWDGGECFGLGRAYYIVGQFGYQGMGVQRWGVGWAEVSAGNHLDTLPARGGGSTRGIRLAGLFSDNHSKTKFDDQGITIIIHITLACRFGIWRLVSSNCVQIYSDFLIHPLLYFCSVILSTSKLSCNSSRDINFKSLHGRNDSEFKPYHNYINQRYTIYTSVSLEDWRA